MRKFILSASIKKFINSKNVFLNGLVGNYKKNGKIKSVADFIF